MAVIVDQALPVQEALSRLDVDLVGVASVAELAEQRLRKQAGSLLPGTKSIVVMAMEIFPEVLDHSSPDGQMGEGSPRDILGPHMDYLNGRLSKGIYDLARVCHRHGFKAFPLHAGSFPTDARYLVGILSYKHAAEAAELGTIGWSSLLITPRFGPRVRLGCILTDAALAPTRASVQEVCTGCTDCVSACPAKAITAPENGQPYAIDKYACRVFRGASGGCTECMRVCQQGR